MMAFSLVSAWNKRRRRKKSSHLNDHHQTTTDDPCMLLVMYPSSTLIFVTWFFFFLAYQVVCVHQGFIGQFSCGNLRIKHPLKDLPKDTMDLLSSRFGKWKTLQVPLAMPTCSAKVALDEFIEALAIWRGMFSISILSFPIFLLSYKHCFYFWMSFLFCYLPPTVSLKFIPKLETKKLTVFKILVLIFNLYTHN